MRNIKKRRFSLAFILSLYLQQWTFSWKESSRKKENEWGNEVKRKLHGRWIGSYTLQTSTCLLLSLVSSINIICIYYSCFSSLLTTDNRKKLQSLFCCYFFVIQFVINLRVFFHLIFLQLKICEGKIKFHVLSYSFFSSFPPFKITYRTDYRNKKRQHMCVMCGFWRCNQDFGSNVILKYFLDINFQY